MTRVFAFKESVLILTFMQDWNEDSYQVQNIHATQQLCHAATTSFTSCNTSRFGLLSFNSFCIAIPLNIQLHKYIAGILQLWPTMKSIQFICPSWSLSLTLAPVGWRFICNCSVCPGHRSLTSLCDLKEEQNTPCLLCTQTYHKTVLYTAQSEIFCGLLIWNSWIKIVKLWYWYPFCKYLKE